MPGHTGLEILYNSTPRLKPPHNFTLISFHCSKFGYRIHKHRVFSSYPDIITLEKRLTIYTFFVRNAVTLAMLVYREINHLTHQTWFTPSPLPKFEATISDYGSFRVERTFSNMSDEPVYNKSTPTTYKRTIRITFSLLFNYNSFILWCIVRVHWLRCTLRHIAVWAYNA